MAEDRNCYRHSETAASGTCIECGQPICRDCMVQVQGQIYCGMECAETRQSRLNRVVPSSGSRMSMGGCLLQIIIAVAIVAGVYVVFGFQFGFEAVHEYLKEILRSAGLIGGDQGMSQGSQLL